MQVWRRRDWLVLAPLSLCTSCDPLIDVAGAFFPAWILCIFVAIVATVLLRFAFARTRIEPGLGPLVVIYPSLATALALTVWLLLFRQ